MKLVVMYGDGDVKVSSTNKVLVTVEGIVCGTCCHNFSPVARSRIQDWAGYSQSNSRKENHEICNAHAQLYS